MARFPSRIGRYDLITALATGGMGRIYLGRAVGIGGFERKVVIKTIEAPLTADSDPAVAMFLDEARVLGLLHHQHIASVFEVGKDDDGRFYMVLEYLEGFSAHDVWERAAEVGAALPLDFTLTVVSAVANGLHYAHTRKDTDGTPHGIVHRDVTPSNVMIGHDGAVKIIDFGIAMAADRKTKTQTGFVKGKVGYLSPEQVSGRDVDARTDVFALGILLYELSTQHRAFRDTSDLATMQRIKAGKLVRPSQLIRDYPVELEAIVMKALQVDPRDRFGDADGMRRAIEALGHRLRFVLGDAAIIEVMAQLFDARAAATKDAVPSRMSDPAFEWLESDHALTVRREPEELLAALRSAESSASGISGISGVEESMTRPLGSMSHTDERPRKLRAATEAANALGAQAFDTPMPGLPVASMAPPPTPPAVDQAFDTPMPGLPLASPPPTPLMTAMPTAKPKTPRGMTAAATPAPQPEYSASVSTIGATVVKARKRRGSALRWIAVFALAGVLGAIGYLATREGPDAVAGSPPLPPPPPPPPVAARAPLVPPAPAKAAHAEPPPRPATIRVRIVTHPAEATVLLDGKRLGHTPLDETIASDPGKHVIKLRHRGYTTYQLEVTLDGDITQDVFLTPSRGDRRDRDRDR